MQPKVSILIPAYNVEDYIAECIRSVLAQTFSDMEIIIVDDGSTDGTVDEIQQFSDERIRVFSQQNSGLSMARNIALSYSRGHYVLFLDSDDRLHEKTVQTCFDIAQECHVDSVTFDGYDFQAVNGVECAFKGGYFDRSSRLTQGVYSGMNFLKAEVFRKAVVVSAPLYFVKKECLKQISFEKDLLHEDVLYHYQLIPILGSIYYLPKLFYQRRLREGSIVHLSPSLNSIVSYKRIITVLDEMYTNASASNKLLYRKIIQKNMLQVGKLAKRYLLGKSTSKKQGVKVLCETILSSSATIRFYKAFFFLLGFSYYLFADIRLKKQ